MRLLGELQVVRDARAASLPASKKTRALLAYLVATGRPHSRERLCELLWPGPDDPRAALRWSLTKIRELLDDEARVRVVADRERVAFEAHGATSDVEALRTLVSTGIPNADTRTLRGASELFRGELGEGLDVADAYRYEEWLASEREAARGARVRILGTLVDRLRSEPEAALPFARQRVAIDPLSEAAHVAVIELLAQLGKKREALAQFEACARILETELHAKPGPAMLAARMGIGRRADSVPPTARSETIESRSPGSLPPSRAQPPSSSVPLIPLFGREREVEAVRRHVQALLGRPEDAANARLLLFAGEPGIGKSRLLDELGREAVAAGARVLRGRAYEAEMVRPYGAWIDALRSTELASLAGARRTDLAPLLPELGDAAGITDRSRLFDAVSAFLASLASAAPVLVLLDDVQWFDDASAALLHAAVRASGRARVGFACGARSEELGDNPAALKLVRALGREGWLARIDLGPLDAEAGVRLAHATVPSIDAERVMRESAGNPLFVIEVARALARGDDALAESLDALIADRLASLDESARELVPWAAALGGTFGLDVLDRATGLGGRALVQALAALEEHGILRADPSGERYDFVHDLLRNGAYRRLSPPRRRLVHLQIARALAAGAPSDGSLAGDVAHHAGLGGDTALAARASLQAAERALRLFASAEAARLASSGLLQASRLPADERFPLQLGLWRVKVMSTTWREGRIKAGAELSAFITQAREAGFHGEAAMGLHTLSMLQRDGGDLDGAHASTLRAVDVARHADPVVAAAQLCDSARCLAMLEREMPRADALLHEAQALLGERAEQTLQYLWGRALMDRFRGDLTGARRRIGDAIRLARKAEDHWADCEALMSLVEMELDEGRPALALDYCVALRTVAAKMGEGSEGPAAEALEMLARAALEEPVDAALERALEVLREIDAKGMLAGILTRAALLDLDRGRTESARERGREALRAAEIVERRTRAVLARVVLGEVARRDGDRRAALDQLDAMRADVSAPLLVSAHARLKAYRLAEALGAPIEGDRPCLT